MYGPGTGIMLREATHDHKLGDIPILKGTGLYMSAVPNHYNPKYFPEPFEFKP
jgi:cytochrome P450